MKKQLVTTLLGLLSVVVYGQQEANCTINIQFPASVPVKTAQQVFLTMNDQTDSTTVVNGLASFKRQVDKPVAARLMLKRAAGVLSYGDTKWIYLDRGIITVILQDVDSVFKSAVKGPLVSTTYDQQLRIPIDYYGVQIRLINIAYRTAKKEKRADTILLKEQEDKSIRACFQVPQTYIKAHPGSSLSIVALNFLGNGGYPMTIADLESLYNSLDAPVRTSEDGLKYADKLQKLKAAQAAREAKQAAKQKEG